LIVVMFILGTDSVLALVPKQNIDLVSPIPQTLSVGFASSGIATLIAPALIVGANLLGAAIYFARSSRAATRV
jgi:hypothetical protein